MSYALLSCAGRVARFRLYRNDNGVNVPQGGQKIYRSDAFNVPGCWDLRFTPGGWYADLHLAFFGPFSKDAQGNWIYKSYYNATFKIGKVCIFPLYGDDDGGKYLYQSACNGVQNGRVGFCTSYLSGGNQKLICDPGQATVRTNCNYMTINFTSNAIVKLTCQQYADTDFIDFTLIRNDCS